MNHMKVIHDQHGKRVATIFSWETDVDTSKFFSENTEILQVGLIVVKPDKPVLRHVHNDISRKTVGTSEVLIVIEGEALMSVYSQEEEFIESVRVRKGDVISLISGGHGFSSEGNAKFIEVKNGPFAAELDKRYF